MLFVFVACGSVTSSPEKQNHEESSKVKNFEDGIKFIEDGKYLEADSFFENYLTKNPVSSRVPQALFYSAIAKIELEQFQDAVNKLLAVQKLSEGKDQFLEAESLFHLARAYEGLSNDSKALAAYLDAERRSKFLKKELSEIEVPARIAGVYARQKNLEMADKYYAKADVGLSKVKDKSGNEKREWIPQSLFGMGKVSPRSITEADYDNELKSLRRSQGYLIRAIEFGHSKWSDRAEKELEFIYNSAWSVIESYPVKETDDKLAALKMQQERMIELGIVLNKVLNQLQQEFIPGDSSENQYIKKLKSFIEGFEKRLDALISSRPVQEGLTPEAQLREGLIRSGKVVDPEGKLEQNQKRLTEELPTKEKK